MGQLALLLWPPDVTVRLAVCVPELENVLLQVELDPVQAPDHEYTYEPVPPDTLE